MSSRATGSSTEFEEAYERHDIAEGLVMGTLEALGVPHDKAGFDPHDDDGNRVIGHARSPDRGPDIRAVLPIEVKTKTNAEHLGNVPKRKWDDYPTGTWFAWFHVTKSGRVPESACFQKGHDCEIVGEEDTPYGDTMLRVRPLRHIKDMYTQLEELSA